MTRDGIMTVLGDPNRRLICNVNECLHVPVWIADLSNNRYLAFCQSCRDSFRMGQACATDAVSMLSFDDFLDGDA